MKRLLLLVACSLLLFSCSKKNNSAPGTLPNAYSDQGIGASAHDMLSADKYNSISIQIQYMPGFQPDSTAIADLQTYLAGLCNKPGGITVSQSQVAANGDTLNVSKVAIIEAQDRTSYTSGSNLALYILITDGYDTSNTTLGYAFRNTSIALFGKNIFDHSGGTGQITRTALEASVLEHEAGHLMGLVNLGSPMQTAHQDVAHGYHCTNTKCLMYYAMELHTGYFSYASIPKLDSNCLADLHANGGK